MAMKMITGITDSLFSYPSIDGEVFLNNTQKFSSCHKKKNLLHVSHKGRSDMSVTALIVYLVCPENSTKRTVLSSGCGQYSEIVNEQDSVSVTVDLYAAVT
jgi:hypothetical protein